MRHCKSSSAKTPLPRRSPVLRVLYWVLGGISALILGSALIFAGVQTETGKRILVSWIAGAVESGTGSPIRIGPVHGLVPLDFRVDSLEMGDESDPWLRVEGIAIRWFPKSLLKGRIRVGLVEVDAVDILGRPPKRAEHGKSTEGGFSWPPDIPPVLLERLLVKQISVGSRILGEEAVFHATARMDVTGHGKRIQGECTVHRVDGPREKMEVTWSLDTASPDLEIDLRIVEPENGTLLRSAGLDSGAASLRLKGAGPLHAWTGELDVETGHWGTIRTGLRIRADRDRLRVQATGGLSLNRGLMPSQVSELIGPGDRRFTLDATYTAEGILSLDRLDLSGDGAKIGLSGQYEPAAETGHVRVDLSLPELDRLVSSRPAGLAGRLRCRAHIRVNPDGSQADAVLEMTRIHASGVTAEQASASFRFRPARGAHFPFLEGLGIHGEGEIQDLAARAGSRDIRLPRMGWSMDWALLSPNRLSIRDFHLTDENASLSFSGQALLTERSLNGEARLEIEDLSRMPFPTGFHWRGGVDVSARVQASQAGRSVSAEVEGVLKGVGPFPHGLNALVGEAPRIKGRVALQDGRTIHVTDSRIELEGGHIRASGRVDLAEKTGTASMRVEVPDISVCSSVVGRRLRGNADLRVSMNGPLDHPEARAVLTVLGLGVDRFQVGKAHMSVQARGPVTAPRAAVEIEVEHPRGGDVRGAAGAELEWPILRIPELSLQGAGSRVNGSLNVDLKALGAEGVLKGTITDLAALTGLWMEGFGGAGEVSVGLSHGGLAQDLRVHARIHDLVGPPGRAERVEFRADARDVLGAVSGTVKADITALEYRGARMETLEMEARGGIDRMDIRMAGKGRYHEPFRVSWTGAAGRTPGEAFFECSSLEGAFGSFPVRLERPVGMRISEKNHVEWDPLVLHMGNGSISMEGRVGETMDLQTVFRDLPLSMWKGAGMPSLTGNVSGRLHVTGSLREPSADLSVDVRSLRLADPSRAQLPLLDLASHASLGSGRLQADLSVSGLGDRPMEIAVVLPVAWSISPFSFALAEEGAIQGSAWGAMAMDPLPAWFSLPDHRLSGRLTLDGRLGGTVASPDIHGGIRVQEGTVEYLPGGIVIRDLDLAVRMSPDALTIESARATDGGEGRMELDAHLRLDPDRDFPFTGRVRLNDFRLIRLDDLNVVTHADTTVRGSAEAATISGDIRLVSALFRIPDRMPSKIERIDVVEVNRPGSAHTQPLETTPSETEAIHLDMNVVIPGRAFVKGHGLDSEWKGSLVVTGEAGRPEVRGDLDIVRGHYDFFGKRFSLVSGSLFFDGTHPPNPTLQVTAEHRAMDMTAQVELSGTPDTLRLQVTSNPPLPQDEVMARLLFGRSLTTITPFQALKLARAMDALAGGRTFGFVDRAQEAIGVDRLEVRPSEGEGGLGTLSAGKYVGEGVYMEVEKGLGSEDGKISLEYEVTPRITVETEAGTDANGGVGVKWTWDY